MFPGCIYVSSSRGISFAIYANRTSSRHARQGEPQHAPRFDHRESHANCRARNISDGLNRHTYLPNANHSLIWARTRGSWFHETSLRRMISVREPECVKNKVESCRHYVINEVRKYHFRNEAQNSLGISMEDNCHLNLRT